MNKTALIFGAGKTGRGFAAQLAFLGGYEIILVDKNKELVADLKTAGHYDVQILGHPTKSSTIIVSGVYHTDDISWHHHLVHTGLMFTAVFGNNLEAVARDLAPALTRRYCENKDSLLTIITCENLTNAAALLRAKVIENLGEEMEGWLSRRVGFSESIVFRTCLEPGKEQSPLTVLAQNFFELPCDGDALQEKPDVFGLKPLKNFQHQLRRKIYTYNCINAVISYLGAKKGYSQLAAAANDPAILSTAQKAARETCVAQVAEFNFDNKEQEEWLNAAFVKFQDNEVPDPINRNTADPERKLGREDRLIGPALLALKHNIYPEGLVAGIMACIEYKDPDKGRRISDLVFEKGPDYVLNAICGLSTGEELFSILKKQLTIKIRNVNQ